MEMISETLVEETWEEVAGFSPPHGQNEMSKLEQEQPEILSFLVEFTKDLKQDVQELAIYIFFVVYRIFKKSSGKKIRKISADEIIECFESNEKLMEKLEGTHEKFLERITRTQILTQPYVMKYVVDTLMEAPEEEDPIHLTEEDTGYLFLLLKTVIDLLDKTS